MSTSKQKPARVKPAAAPAVRGCAGLVPRDGLSPRPGRWGAAADGTVYYSTPAGQCDARCRDSWTKVFWDGRAARTRARRMALVWRFDFAVWAVRGGRITLLARFAGRTGAEVA